MNEPTESRIITAFLKPPLAINHSFTIDEKQLFNNKEKCKKTWSQSWLSILQAVVLCSGLLRDNFEQKWSHDFFCFLTCRFSWTFFSGIWGFALFKKWPRIKKRPELVPSCDPFVETRKLATIRSQDPTLQKYFLCHFTPIWNLSSLIGWKWSHGLRQFQDTNQITAKWSVSNGANNSFSKPIQWVFSLFALRQHS